MSKKVLVLMAVLGSVLVAAGVSVAAGITASLFGGAVAEQSDVKLTSDFTDASTSNDFSGIAFTLPGGTTFADLKTLSAEFNPTAGSPASGSTTPVGCGQGSPRFSIKLAGGGDVNVALGPSPNFDSCALNTWQSTGNLIGNNDAGRYDTSHVAGGSPFTTYSAALALVGSRQVTEIDLIVDAGKAFTPQVQTVLVRNVQINEQTFFAQPTPPSPGKAKSPAQQCKAELALIGKTAFEKKYGHNHNLRNAMGKCVSQRTRAAHHKH